MGGWRRDLRHELCRENDAGALEIAFGFRAAICFGSLRSPQPTDPLRPAVIARLDTLWFFQPPYWIFATLAFDNGFFNRHAQHRLQDPSPAPVRP